MTTVFPDSAEVLAANGDFYQAFAKGDTRAMDRLWAVENPVSCLHPGWPIILGRYRVMASWRAILRRPPPIHCREPRIVPFDRMTLVICCEAIDNGLLTASNLFVREDDEWRLVHHQSCPCSKELLESLGHEMKPRALH